MSRLPQAERGVGKAISWPTGGLLRRLWRLAMTGVGSGQKTAQTKWVLIFGRFCSILITSGKAGMAEKRGLKRRYLRYYGRIYDAKGGG